MKNILILTLICMFLASFHSRAMEREETDKNYIVKTAKIPQTIAIKSCVIKAPESPARKEIEAIEAAIKNYKRGMQQPLRKLDLKDYPCLTSLKGVIDDEFGYQFTDYGPFESVMLTDVQYFVPAKKSDPMIWIDYGSGFGAFPLRVYGHTLDPANARLIVNDLNENNLQSLQKLISKNKGLASVFKIISGDCLLLHKAPLFKQNVPERSDFISALNIVHFLTPYKVVHLFANASESLKVGGKFYVMHDLERLYQVDSYEEETLKLFSKDYSQSVDSKEYESQLKSILENYRTLHNYLSIKYRFINDFLQKNKILFPSFWSKNLLTGVLQSPVDTFAPSPEFIEEVASRVGLRLEREMPLHREILLGASTIKNASKEEANAIGYVLVKEKNDCSFRHTSTFEELIKRTELADEQRKKIKFRGTPWYPFMEEF